MKQSGLAKAIQQTVRVIGCPIIKGLCENLINLFLVKLNKMKTDLAIRAQIDVLINAIRAKDIIGVMSVFAPEVVSFDFGPPLQHGGGEVFLKRWQELFELYQSTIEYELIDLSITVDDNVAFSHSLNKMGGTLKNGQKSERWLRWTACYFKLNGTWLIVHEHVSVPSNIKSGKAMLNLRPSSLAD